MNTRFNSRGFSLIEVMVALLVLALGILGISKLQSTLIRTGSDANQRAVAVSIAQEKIDDLKSFSKVSTSTSWADALAAANSYNEVAYEHITGVEIDASDDNAINQAFNEINETGGLIPPSDKDDNSNVVSVGPTKYFIAWSVEDYLFSTPFAAASEATPTLDSDLKLVTVFVGWDDELGEPQKVSLSTAIDSRNPGLIALSAAGKEGAAPPVAEYIPEEAPDVINVQVDTGGNKFRQTSKPLPDAISQGQDANTVVSFEVVTYSTYSGPITGLNFVADTIEEFVTVDCKCQFSASNSVSRTAAHVQWNPETDSRFDYPGDLVSKQTATPVDNVNEVDDLCTTCCRDHHDVDDPTIPVYVPGTTGGNHTHYDEFGVEAIQSNGDTYLESCRMKRIDGIYRVFQDWNLYDLTVIERGQLADGAALQTPYSDYVQDFVLDYMIDPDTAVKPSARSPVTLTEGAGAQLQSRGVFIDNVYDETGSVNPADYVSYVSSDTNTDRVDKIPFAEVNLTLLSNWSSSNTDKVTVTSEPVATIPDSAVNYYGLYSRGFIVALDEVDPDPTVTAEMRIDNDGLTQLTSRPSPGTQTDSVDIDISAGLGPITLTFSFDGVNYPTTREGTPELSITGGGVCNPVEATNSFNCFVTSPWTGTAQLSVAVTNGPQNARCEGLSAVYSGSALTVDTSHNFGIIECD